MRTCCLRRAGFVPLAKYPGDLPSFAAWWDDYSNLAQSLFDHGDERTYIHNNVTAHCYDSATNRNRVRGEIDEIVMLNTQIREMLVGRVFQRWSESLFWIRRPNCTPKLVGSKPKCSKWLIVQRTPRWQNANIIGTALPHRTICHTNRRKRRFSKTSTFANRHFPQLATTWNRTQAILPEIVNLPPVGNEVDRGWNVRKHAAKSRRVGPVGIR